MAKVHVSFALKVSTAHPTQQTIAYLCAVLDISVQMELDLLINFPVILDSIILMKVLHLKTAVFLVCQVNIALAMVSLMSVVIVLLVGIALVGLLTPTLLVTVDAALQDIIALQGLVDQHSVPPECTVKILCYLSLVETVLEVTIAHRDHHYQHHLVFRALQVTTVHLVVDYLFHASQGLTQLLHIINRSVTVCLVLQDSTVATIASLCPLVYVMQDIIVLLDK